MQEGQLRILYIAHERKLGGASLSLITLIKEMQKNGHEIYAIVPKANCPVAYELKKLGIFIIPIFMPWWQMPSYWNKLIKLCFRIFYLLEIFEICYAIFRLRKIKLDIVHSNSSVIDFGAKIAQFKKCKHVWHIREFGDADYDLEYLCGKSKTWRYISEHADQVIFISQALLNYFKSVIYNGKNIVVYNGISKDYIVEREYTDKEEISFLISGNLNKNKQQLLVLQAGAELLKRGMDNFKIVIVGTYSSMKESKQYEEELKDYIKIHLPNNAILLGRVDMMNNIRKQSDVEIVASNKEAFGRVTIEAMLAGMPVIVSDSGANVELVSNGEQGFLFCNGNHVDLANQMQQFISSPQLLEKMGKNAFMYVKNRFTAENNAREINNIYHMILR